MKGFGIEIKNTLLDPKHVQNMGQAVWLYMFLIDKITEIKDGLGIVLGGKPIKYEEVKAELGIHQNTYSDWIKKLAAYPYIIATRTPYGISYRVFKAYKRFGRFTGKGEVDSQKRVNLRRFPTEKGESNKTVSVRDNTVDREGLEKLKGMKRGFSERSALL